MWWDEQVNGTGAAMLPAVRHPNRPAPVLAVAPAHLSTGGQQGQLQTPSADLWQWWWRYAQHSARGWLNGIAPPVIDIFGPVLDADEEGLLETEMTYSRLYGGDGRYNRSDLFVVGRPAVMAGALAVNAAVNHHRKVAARRESEVRWRNTQTVRVWATTHRLVCDSSSHGVVSFYYEVATEFYPDLDSWSLTLGFGEECLPVRLSGPAAPAICLWAAIEILGERWVRDPRLARLVA
jgi:hypothetical protein